jgi:hypothetical protein
MRADPCKIPDLGLTEVSGGYRYNPRAEGKILSEGTVRHLISEATASGTLFLPYKYFEELDEIEAEDIPKYLVMPEGRIADSEAVQEIIEHWYRTLPPDWISLLKRFMTEEVALPYLKIRLGSTSSIP